MKVKVGAPLNRFNLLPLPVNIIGRPKAILSSQFQLFYVRCCSFFNLILTFLYV